MSTLYHRPLSSIVSAPLRFSISPTYPFPSPRMEAPPCGVDRQTPSCPFHFSLPPPSSSASFSSHCRSRFFPVNSPPRDLYLPLSVVLFFAVSLRPSVTDNVGSTGRFHDFRSFLGIWSLILVLRRSSVRGLPPSLVVELVIYTARAFFQGFAFSFLVLVGLRLSCSFAYMGGSRLFPRSRKASRFPLARNLAIVLLPTFFLPTVVAVTIVAVESCTLLAALPIFFSFFFFFGAGELPL